MEKSDKQFWELTKQISGLQAARTKSAPSAKELAKQFANKMSNGAEVYDNDWVPSENWRKKETHMSSFRIRLKDVLKSLKSLDPSKSMNGIPNIMLRECANVLHTPLTLLFRLISSSGVFPTRWKLGRITALHKRGKISSPKMYRPVQVLDNCESCFEDVIMPQM
jgi:hypothetical protein